MHFQVSERKLTFMYCCETPNIQEAQVIKDKIDISSYILGDLNLCPSRSKDQRILDILCGNERMLHLRAITTISQSPNQLDHIMVRLTIKHLVVTETFFNFISDHKSIIMRLTAFANDEPLDKMDENDVKLLETTKAIKREINKDVEKLDCKKIKIKISNEIIDIDDKSSLSDTQSDKSNQIYYNSLRGNNWVSNFLIDDYCNLLMSKYKNDFVFSTFFTEISFHSIDHTQILLNIARTKTFLIADMYFSPF